MRVRFLKLCSIVFALAMLMVATPEKAYADGTDFLIDEWSTSDGVTLIFYDDGMFEMEWGYFPAEQGAWYAEQLTDSTYNLEMDGSLILSLMSKAYGSTSSDYHFEILKCNEDNFYLVQVYDDYTAVTSPCKLGFTRYGAEPDFEITNTQNNSEESADEEEAYDPDQGTTFYWDNGETTIDNHWNWQLFDRPATEYNHDLAISGLAISQFIHNPDTFEDRLYEEFGFDDVYFKKHATSSTPSYAFAYHKENLAGQEKYIVLVALRGTNADLDGLNDIVNDIGSQFAGMGFREGTERINDALKQYIASIGCNKENTILFITGHSLGGGIAQSLAPFAENYTSSNDNCFIYTYAATNVFIDMLHNGSYDNVHNIINTQDAVPHLPIFYGKYGHRWYYDSSDPKYNPYYEKIYNTENWSGNVFDAHNHKTYLAMMLCDLPQNMGEGAENPYSYTSIHCPVDIEVRDANGNLIGSTTGDEVSIEDSSSVLILAHDGEKEVIAPPGVDYTVDIIGTDDGQMTVTLNKINSYDENVLEEKEFADVPVTKDQQFELVVDNSSFDCIELVSNANSGKKGSGKKNSSIPWRIIILIVVSIVVIGCIAFAVRHYLKEKKRKEAEARAAKARAAKARAAKRYKSRY